MSRFLYRLGRFSSRHRRWVVAAWVIAVVGLFVVGKVAGGATHDSFSVPGVESQKATDLLTASFPTQAGASAQVVFHATEGTLSDPANAAAMAGALDALGSLDHVVVPPPSATLQTSAEDTVALATVRYDDDAHNLPGDTYSQLKSAVGPAVGAGLQVEFGGEIPSAADRTPPSSAEGIGLLVAMVILVLAFGSVIAMGLPIGTALFGLAAGAATITFLSAFIDLPSTTEVLATMIGLGVGIDYALFIITRHRAGLHRGLTVEDAVGRSIATAGLSVMIAGGTVVIAILGLAVAGIPFVTFMGVGAALVVAIMVIASLTLLPALIGFAGHNIDRFGIPGTKRVSETRTHDDDGHYRGWARWAHHVSAHPVIYLVAGLTVVIMLAAPLFTMRLGQTDASQNPTSSTLRRSYDLLAEGFGPGFSGPLVLAIDLSGTTNDNAALAAIESAVKADPGVAEASPAVVGPGGDVAVIQVTPTTGPQDEATTELVNRLRGDVLPPIVASFDTPVHVGGQTAVFIDMSERILSRLPLFIGCVVGLSFVLLLIVFRSILVPIKAAVMNLLSIGAAYGVVVLVFQKGYGAGLIGIHESLPIVSFIPMFMFAILFGLSMDYEVFLLSRIREEFNQSHDNTESVIVGITTTARVITCAALIMVSVFISFVFGGDPTIKMFGIGLSTAVLVDATIIRLVLVPATMKLLGNANWWFPKWLDRILPNVDIEGETRLPAPELEGDLVPADEPVLELV